MNDEQLEQVIQTNSLNAPRVSVDTIRALMERVTYVTVVPVGTTSTFVHAFLDGRFHLGSGFSACVSPANFDTQIGIDIAKPKAIAAAREKLWELEGYRLYRSGAPARTTHTAPLGTDGMITADQARANVAACVDRMVTEMKELAQRVTKLGAFVAPQQAVTTFGQLPHTEQRLLIDQYEAMQRYLEVLSARVALAQM